MRLSYLPANGLWCVTMGDSIVTIDLRDAGRPVRFFSTRSEAVKALASIGLRVSKSGRID